MSPPLRCFFAQGVTCLVLLKVVIDGIITLGDSAFDIFMSHSFYKAGHRKWFSASIVAIFLPGITCTFAQLVQCAAKTGGQGSWREELSVKNFLRLFINLFCYPLWVLYLGYKTLTQIPDVKLMVHVKAWEGLLESSWMFLIQVVVFQYRPPIGDRIIFGYYVEHGEFWFRVFGIVFAFLCFLYTVTEYHILLDGKVSQPKRQLIFVPFFTVNFLFRCLTLSLFWVYWKEPAVFVCIMLYLLNLFITRRTLLKSFNDRVYQHLPFCCIVGGMVSQLTPALALFYGQTANKKTINYFYKRNIRINNCVLLLIFTGLVLHLNLNPDDRSLLNRNTFLGCHKPGLDYTMDELGIYDEVDYKEINSTINTMTYFGMNWTVREATNYEAQTHDCTDNNTDCMITRPLYIIAEECQEGQAPVDRFNKIAVPVIYGLGIVSTLTSFSTFHMD